MFPKLRAVTSMRYWSGASVPTNERTAAPRPCSAKNVGRGPPPVWRASETAQRESPSPDGGGLMKDDDAKRPLKAYATGTVTSNVAANTAVDVYAPTLPCVVVNASAVPIPNQCRGFAKLLVRLALAAAALVSVMTFAVDISRSPNKSESN